MLQLTLSIDALFEHFKQSANKLSQICQSKSYIAPPRFNKKDDGWLVQIYWKSRLIRPCVKLVGSLVKFSQAFSKLRVSSHRLEIEAGRWTKPRAIPRDDRKCHNCEILEDEFHFVIECPMYLELRKRYISKYYWRRPSMFKFVELINSSNTSCIRKLCTYIFHAFKLRSELLYN